MLPVDTAKLPLFSRILHEEEGQSLVEYALLTSLIALVCVAALSLLRTRIRQGFNAAFSGLNTSSV